MYRSFSGGSLTPLGTRECLALGSVAVMVMVAMLDYGFGGPAAAKAEGAANGTTGEFYGLIERVGYREMSFE